MKQIVVVAAILVKDQQILCVQRGPHKFSYISKKFEFPGGKVEMGETNEQALSRELIEELNLNIEVGNHFVTVEHEYPDFTVLMHSYLCKSINSQALQLTEHIDFKWLPAPDLDRLDWAAADIPIVELLQASFHEHD